MCGLQEAGGGRKERNDVVRFFLCTGGIFLLDQATKYLALHLLDPCKPAKILPAFFWLILRHNSGAAFSLFTGQTALLTVFTGIACALIIWWGIKIPPGEKTLQISLGLIGGGALGNLFDRFFRGGLVVDFLDLHWFNKIHWPTFNIADTAICIGVGLIMLDTLILRKKAAGVRTAGKKA